MLNEIKRFINENRHCVLATSTEDIPYCSLMAYINNDECTKIYMASYTNTRKVRNLKKNKNLSLIIDSRETDNPRALTIQGEYAETDKNLYDNFLKEFHKYHPSMDTFLNNENIEFITVNIKAFMYINGFEDTCFIEIQ